MSTDDVTPLRHRMIEDMNAGSFARVRRGATFAADLDANFHRAGVVSCRRCVSADDGDKAAPATGAPRPQACKRENARSGARSEVVISLSEKEGSAIILNARYCSPTIWGQTVSARLTRLHVNGPLFTARSISSIASTLVETSGPTSSRQFSTAATQA
jgi:hypothetical protein